MAMGVHQAKQALMGLLQSRIVEMCTRQELFEGIQPGEIPVPTFWDVGPERDPVDVVIDASTGLYPAVFVDGTQSSTGPIDLQRVSGGVTYLMAYDLRIVWHCRRESTRDASLVVLDRDRLDAVFRRLLISYPSVNAEQMVQRPTIRPEYGDVFEDRQKRPVAAGALMLVMHQQETVVNPPLTDPSGTSVGLVVTELS